MSESSENESESIEKRNLFDQLFLFTSGCASPHHDHQGYGLKRGLESTASYELVLILESACVELIALRVTQQGTLCALDVDGEPIWRGAVKVTEGHEPSGRANMSVEGPLPPEQILHNLYAWGWIHPENQLTQGEGELSLLVSAESLIDYLRRNQLADAPLLEERQQSGKKRSSLVTKRLLVGVGVGITLLVFAFLFKFVIEIFSKPPLSSPPQSQASDHHPTLSPQTRQPHLLDSTSSSSSDSPPSRLPSSTNSSPLEELRPREEYH